MQTVGAAQAPVRAATEGIAGHGALQGAAAIEVPVQTGEGQSHHRTALHLLLKAQHGAFCARLDDHVRCATGQAVAIGIVQVRKLLVRQRRQCRHAQAVHQASAELGRRQDARGRGHVHMSDGVRQCVLVRRGANASTVVVARPQATQQAVSLQEKGTALLESGLIGG